MLRETVNRGHIVNRHKRDPGHTGGPRTPVFCLGLEFSTDCL